MGLTWRSCVRLFAVGLTNLACGRLICLIVLGSCTLILTFGLTIKHPTLITEYRILNTFFL